MKNKLIDAIFIIIFMLLIWITVTAYEQQVYMNELNETISEKENIIVFQQQKIETQQTIIETQQTIIEIQLDIDEHIPDRYPTVYRSITSYYGYRTNPTPTFHPAVDFENVRGTDIVAAGTGIVTIASYQGQYGRVIKIDHGNGYETLYAHCSKLYVEVGQEVEKGQLIAAIGSSGYATGCHLHFEVLYNKKNINPLSILTEGS